MARFWTLRFQEANVHIHLKSRNNNSYLIKSASLLWPGHRWSARYGTHYFLTTYNLPSTFVDNNLNWPEWLTVSLKEMLPYLNSHQDEVGLSFRLALTVICKSRWCSPCLSYIKWGINNETPWHENVSNWAWMDYCHHEKAS